MNNKMKRFILSLVGCMLVSAYMASVGFATNGSMYKTVGPTVAESTYGNILGPIVPVTAEEFGAVPDDSADDTIAIQKALNTAAALDGAVVYFPAGVYNTSDNLIVYSNTKVKGTNAAIVKQDTPSSYAVLVIGSNQSNITIEGIRLENNKATGCIGIDLGSGASNVRIVANTFNGVKAQAISINTTGVKHVTVTENEFDGVNYGVLTNERATDVEDVRIENNRFTNIYGDAIELNHPGNAYVAGSNIVIANNYISVPEGLGSSKNAGFGIGIAGATHVTITGNVFENVRYQAIHIEDEAKHISVIGNTIDRVGSMPDNGTNSGIYVLDGDYITVIGNNVNGAADYGIHLEYDGTNQGTNTIISGNTVTGSQSGGIRIGGKGYSDLIVSDNIITNNAGNGIHINGEARNLKITDNISRENTGYGFYTNRSGTSWSISGNSFYGNTFGDIGYNHAALTYPIPLADNNTIVMSEVSASDPYSGWVDTFSLGKGAEGLLYVTASRNTDSAWATKLLKISWDGTNLVYTQAAKDSNGTIDVSSGLQMNGSTLQLRAYSLSAATVTFDVQFQGMILLK